MRTWSLDFEVEELCIESTKIIRVFYFSSDTEHTCFTITFGCDDVSTAITA